MVCEVGCVRWSGVCMVCEVEWGEVEWGVYGV